MDNLISVASKFLPHSAQAVVGGGGGGVTASLKSFLVLGSLERGMF